MKKHLFFSFNVLFFLAFNIHAQTYIREYTYTASEADSKITSRTIALDQVKLILLQEIGTHVRQTININKSESGNTFASEDIEAITAGLTKIDIMEEKWNGATFYLKAKIEADSNRVLNALKEFRNNNKQTQLQLEALKANQMSLEKARDEITQLKQKLNKTKNESQKQKVIVKYIETVNIISTSEMFNKGYESDKFGNHLDAAYWYTKAAEKGHIPAMKNIGWMYDWGEGVKQDVVKSFSWYHKAAELGDAYAQYHTGLMYDIGRGIEMNKNQANILFQRSCKKGEQLACKYLN